MIKKIFFPFCNGARHSFLNKRRWFRLLIVLYIIFIIACIILIFVYSAQKAWMWCYDSIHPYASYAINDKNYTEDAVNNCIDIANGAKVEVYSGTLLSVLFIHYLIQFTFFKVIIDFIYLGPKKEDEISSKE